MEAGFDLRSERLLKLSAFNHFIGRRVAVFLLLSFFTLIFNISPTVYGQDDSFSPFSSLEEKYDGIESEQKLSQAEVTEYQAIFQETDLKSSESSNTPSPMTEQNVTQNQAVPLNSSARHPRVLTQYQTVVQTPSRTLTVQPTGTLPPATVFPPGITAPSITGTGGTTVFPQTTSAGTGTLPPSAVTFPPSVFPPTTSFIPPTSIAPVLGPLSPWFPSIPAIACGGTFTFSVVGSLDRDNDNGNDDGSNDNTKKNGNGNNDNDKDKLYAIQIQSNGGSTLDTDSIEGKVFAGEKNIERNNGEDFDIKDVFNDCQVVTFSN
jgi:hypothetical protein